MLDSCLHFQQTHRNSQFSYGAAFCNLANGSRIFTRFFFFAFHSLPRQTSGSVAAEVHQLVALTASAGCLVARGGFIGRFSLRCCRKRCWWGWIWTVKLRVVKLKQKCWKILKRSVKLRGEICGFVSTTPKKTKNKNRVVIEQHTTRCAACPLRRHRGGNRSISRQTVYTCKIMCIMRAALSRQSAALILWSRTNCPWHIRVGVERYQSHFIEMKELAQTAIWDISHSFFSVTETRSQFTSQVLPVISASLVPPHHKFLFMLTHPTGRPILWPALSQNTPHVGILDVVQAAISSLCAAYTISYTVKEHWI